MNKFIIKNCPAFNGNSEECLKDNGLCEYCTDCIMKQIVAHCRETINVMCADCGSNPYAMGRDLEARLILQKFDIEECE